MARKRRTFSRNFKAKVALEAMKEQMTISQIAGKHGVHPTQVKDWKKQALVDLPEVFGTNKGEDETEQLVSSLYEEIGRLKIQLDWLKKKSKLLSK